MYSSAERLAKIIIHFLSKIIYRVSGDLPGGFVAEQKAGTVPFGPTSSPPTCTDSRLQCQLLLGQNKNSETTLLWSSEFMYVCVRKGDQRVAYI